MNFWTSQTMVSANFYRKAMTIQPFPSRQFLVCFGQTSHCAKTDLPMRTIDNRGGIV